MLLAVVIILVLVLLNACYVAAEFAIVAVRKSRLAELADEGNARARAALAVVTDGARLDRFVAASQIGITLSSLIVGAYGQSAFTPGLATALTRAGLPPTAALSAAAVTVLVVLTAAQVVFGELVPKSLALQRPARVALFLSLPMALSLRLYSAFISLLNGSALLMLKPFGVSPSGHGHVHTADEIELLLLQSQEEGALKLDERNALRRALHLGARRVRQLMVPRAQVEAIDVDTATDEALERIARSRYTRLVVYRGTLDHVVGVVHTTDLVGCRVDEGEPPPLSELVRPVPSVPEDAAADRVLQVFREKRVAVAVVVDERGGMIGITTVGDVLSALLGDVGDELKAAADVEPERLADGRVRIAGDFPLVDAGPWLGTRWRGRAATVGGHILYRLGRLPAPNERLAVDGVRVEIESTDGRAVRSLLIIGPAEEDDDG